MRPCAQAEVASISATGALCSASCSVLRCLLNRGTGAHGTGVLAETVLRTSRQLRLRRLVGFELRTRRRWLGLLLLHRRLVLRHGLLRRDLRRSWAIHAGS